MTATFQDKYVDSRNQFKTLIKLTHRWQRKTRQTANPNVV